MAKLRSITIEEEQILDITRAVLNRLPPSRDLYFQDVSSGVNDTLDYCLEKLIRICMQGRLDKLILRSAKNAQEQRLAVYEHKIEADDY